MTRIINPNSPAKIRNYNQRTIAEVLRRLGGQKELNSESRDMAAILVYSLREIYASSIQTANAWEKRGYWLKADRFLRQWEWSIQFATNLEDVIRNDAWDLLPRLLSELFPYTADIQVKKLTRSQSNWQGAYQKLLAEPPGELPW